MLLEDLVECQEKVRASERASERADLDFGRAACLLACAAINVLVGGGRFLIVLFVMSTGLFQTSAYLLLSLAC